MPAASACAVSSPAVASGTCRPPPTTCASYTGSLSAAPDQPQHGTPPTTGLSSKPLEARQGRLPAMLNRFKRQRLAIQQQALDNQLNLEIASLAERRGSTTPAQRTLMVAERWKADLPLRMRQSAGEGKDPCPFPQVAPAIWHLACRRQP